MRAQIELPRKEGENKGFGEIETILESFAYSIDWLIKAWKNEEYFIY